MGNSQVSKAKAPIDPKQKLESKKEFAQLKQQFGWKDEEQYILMNRQIMYTGSKDEIIANYDNFIQRNILGGQNAEISIPLGIYNHYSDYFNNTILECFNQLNHTNPYNDDFPLQKKCQNGINEWLLIAYMNCRSCKEKNVYSVRFMFQVAVYTRRDKKAQQKLDQIVKEQRIQDQQQIAVANNDDHKEAEREAYKIQIPQQLNEDELAQFQRKFTKYIGDYGWDKEEIFILMERQVLHTGTHDDIIPKYVDFFEKVVFGDKNSDHSMPTGVYDHYLGALTNTIENSLSQVDDEDINEYKDTFKLQQKVDDGEREWLLIALLSCNIATKPSKTKFYVRYAVQVSVYSRVDTRMKQLQKDDKIKKAQEEIFNQVKQQQAAPNDAQEGGVIEITKRFIDVVDYGAMGLKKDNKQNDDKKSDEDNKQNDDKKSDDKQKDNKPKEAAKPYKNNPEPPKPPLQVDFQPPLQAPLHPNNPASLQADNNVNPGNPTDEIKQDGVGTTAEGLMDDAWSMNEDYTAWSCEDLATWIGILNEDFAEKYVDTFLDKELNGENFKNFQSEHYLISKLGMDKNDAEQFATVVKNRIKEKSQLVAANEAPWTCKSCSFINDPKEEKCKICDKPEKQDADGTYGY